MIRVGRKHEPGAIYIGRGSPLGNPFIIGRDGDRDEVIAKYQHWFDDHVAAQDEVVMHELRRIYRIAREQDVVLGCFCSPQACHGDVIKSFLDAYL